MKKWYKNVCILLCVVLSCTMLAACSDLFGGSNKNIEIYISDYELSLSVGQTVKISAVANNGEAVFYDSEKPSVATVDDDGYITAVGAGTTTVYASVKNAYAQCLVTVTEAQSAETPKIFMSVTSATLYVGDELTLSATALDGGAIVYSSTDESVATVSETGKVKAIAAGETAVRAKSGTYSAGCIITVKNLPDSTTTPPVPPKPENPNIDPASPTTGSRTLVWSDEFNGSSLNTDKWSYQVGTKDHYFDYKGQESWGPDYWGNDELQYYTEGDNLTVSDGSLQITAKREQRDNRPFTSSRIVTRDKGYWTFGYMEARIKTPAQQGMWPAFWMLPQMCAENNYGTWAANGEIDIMEAKGRLQNKVDTTIHFGGQWPENTFLTKEYTMSSNTEQWHTYAVDWRAEYIAWYVDGTQVYKLTNDQYYSTSAPDNPSAPFDKPFYILLNLAVGGKYDNYKEPEGSFVQATMYVDYVRVYE